MVSASRLGLKLPFSGETSNTVRCLRPFWSSTSDWNLTAHAHPYALLVSKWLPSPLGIPRKPPEKEKSASGARLSFSGLTLCVIALEKQTGTVSLKVADGASLGSLQQTTTRTNVIIVDGIVYIDFVAGDGVNFTYFLLASQPTSSGGKQLSEFLAQ